MSCVGKEVKEKEFLQKLKDEIGIPLPRICGFQMLVRVYERPKLHKSKQKKLLNVVHPSGASIIDNNANDTNDREVEIALEGDSFKYDKYSNNVGQVIGFGPRAYKDEKFSGWEPYCEIGDWIMFPASIGSDFMYGNIPCRIMPEDKCLLITEDPSYITRT